MSVDKYMENKRNTMIATIDDIDIDKIKIDGVSIRIGDKILKLKTESYEDVPESIQIKEELREKINTQQIKIKKKINEHISEISSFHNSIKMEYERKEKELLRRLENSTAMPDVTYEHAKKGLSVVKGGNDGSLFWLVQGIYYPKFVDEKRIEPKYSKKMITNIIILIKTKGNQVISVTTRKTIGLEYFQHYHQSNPDCWGNWKPPKTFDNVNDIIKIAKDAESVLERINTRSIAKNSPSDLPRISTLKNHLLDNKSENMLNGVSDKIAKDLLRTGTNNIIESNDNVWNSL